MSDENLQVRLAARPDGRPSADDFAFTRQAPPAPGDGQVLLRTRYLSLDPYMRGRMSDAPSYAPPVEVGGVMVGGTIAEVVESRSPGLSPGDLVLAYSGWQKYAVARGSLLRKLDPGGGVPLTTALGVLGMPGLTAYAGLTQIGQPKAGETVVVAAASGPVGASVGQIATILGARAVGIAGGQKKVDYVRSLGFDAAVDHRSPTFREDLAAATPDGIDVYFENVGGHVWDAVFPRLNQFGRVPLCGLVASYNATSLPQGPDRTSLLLAAILKKSLTVRGFIVSDYMASLEAEFLDRATPWVLDGRLRCREDVVDGLENAPAAFIGMLDGQNFGKLLVRV